MNKQDREQMNVVIVGHVDHGKSTLIGRLLADTGSLPEGKLEQVKENCRRNAKPFEYAFLLDALKDERNQGITIDTARCFFKSKTRDYIIIDAPGHIEFLKNMVSGAARAEAALLVIDAKEGIRENSKRHGYMMSFLGIKNVTVCVNKMDLVDYQQDVFETIQKNYLEFLKEIRLVPINFIPIAAREGDNMIKLSDKMPWYKGRTILEALDNFAKEPPPIERDFRFPVQDIYKFTEEDDERRIFAGRVESGVINKGDEVVFLPSKKSTRITSVEAFNLPEQKEAFAGQSTGFTLETQIYIRPGEIMCKVKEKHPHVSTKFRANIFWMGREPFVKSKNYKLKLGTQQVPVVISDIINVLDASVLSSVQNKPQIDRHDVAECVLETLKPIAFDEITNIPQTGRFVIVDNYEISGGGIILAPVFEEQTSLKQHIKNREFLWDRSQITPLKRGKRYQHKSILVVITGVANTGKQNIAKALEEELFAKGHFVYYLGIANNFLSEGTAVADKTIARLQQVQQLGEMAHILTDAGLVLITAISDIDGYDIEALKSLNRPNPTVVINVGEKMIPDHLIDLSLPANENPPQAVEAILKRLSNSIALDPEFTI